MGKDRTMVKGWMVYDAADDRAKSRKYFLDVNNAMAYCESQKESQRSDALMIRRQYMRPEWAEDLHQSRLRCDSLER